MGTRGAIENPHKLHSRFNQPQIEYWYEKLISWIFFPSLVHLFDIGSNSFHTFVHFFHSLVMCWMCIRQQWAHSEERDSGWTQPEASSRQGEGMRTLYACFNRFLYLLSSSPSIYYYFLISWGLQIYCYSPLSEIVSPFLLSWLIPSHFSSQLNHHFVRENTLIPSGQLLLSTRVWGSSTSTG